MKLGADWTFHIQVPNGCSASLVCRVGQCQSKSLSECIVRVCLWCARADVTEGMYSHTRISSTPCRVNTVTSNYGLNSNHPSRHTGATGKFIESSTNLASFSNSSNLSTRHAQVNLNTLTSPLLIRLQTDDLCALIQPAIVMYNSANVAFSADSMMGPGNRHCKDGMTQL